MQTAEFNHEDFSNTAEADKSLLVRFFYKNVHNKLESQQLGRPVFKEKTYIEIRVAGQRDVQACRPVTYADKQRFPRHYEAFEKRVEPPTEGMPLLEFPAITRTQAEELSFMNVKTVEQLASMKDANLSKFMNGYKLRDQAVKWLESNSLAVDAAENKELKEQIATLTEQVQRLMHPNVIEPTTVKITPAHTPSQLTAEGIPQLKSTLDEGVDTPVLVETPIEGAAIAVPAAPAGLPKRKSRRATK
jgi:hypothetical protein